MLDHTHASDARSWVTSANDPATDFPIQNLPFGVARLRNVADDAPRVFVAIGDQALDLAAAALHLPSLFGTMTDVAAALRGATSLNALMALPSATLRALRHALFAVLDASHPDAATHASTLGGVLLSHDALEFFVPARIGDYTDFYASVYHATNVGSMFRPDNPLLPNYKYVPIGYHGRASSIVATDTPVRRPVGQRKGPNDAEPSVGPSRSMDYECEVGVFVRGGNTLGSTIPISAAEEHCFGVCLVNDWSARDVQAWEYQPLGPFLAKNFATTVSPWVVTMSALSPFRAPAFVRDAADPAPLSYLQDAANETHGGIDITLEVRIQSARMRAEGMAPVTVSHTHFTHMYWTLAQMLTHHAMGGCNLQPGDLLASGTVSGPTKSERGCLLELTWRGAEPIALPTGETRAFLEDGDVVELAGWCERDGARRIGLGVCRGEVLPSATTP
jgi:fumarylacetoacetase